MTDIKNVPPPVHHGGRHVPGWVVIQFEKGTPLEVCQGAVEAIGGTFGEGYNGSEIVSYVSVPEGMEEELSKRAIEQPGVISSAFRYS